MKISTLTKKRSLLFPSDLPSPSLPTDPLLNPSPSSSNPSSIRPQSINSSYLRFSLVSMIFTRGIARTAGRALAVKKANTALFGTVSVAHHPRLMVCNAIQLTIN